MPALNNIAIQEMSLNSFSASTPPSLMFPYLLSARYTMKMMNRFAAMMKNHPKLAMASALASR